MIAVPIAALALAVGVVLAAIDGPYAHNEERTRWFSVLLLAVGAATVAAAGALAMRGWLPG